MAATGPDGSDSAGRQRQGRTAATEPDYDFATLVNGYHFTVLGDSDFAARTSDFPLGSFYAATVLPDIFCGLFAAGTDGHPHDLSDLPPRAPAARGCPLAGCRQPHCRARGGSPTAALEELLALTTAPTRGPQTLGDLAAVLIIVL